MVGLLGEVFEYGYINIVMGAPLGKEPQSSCNCSWISITIVKIDLELQNKREPYPCLEFLLEVHKWEIEDEASDNK